MSIAGLLMNILITVLLAVTIAYCWLLNRRIKVLQDGKSELAQLLRHFDESTQRASESIIALQTASKKIGENIQMRIDKANYLLDDLAFMIEKGGKIANNIEAGFAVDRARHRAITEHDETEELAQEAPEPQQARDAQAAKGRDKVSNRDKTAASLEALLERVVGRSKAQAVLSDEPVTTRQAQQQARARSRSEQELLDMLKTGIKG